jgi:phage tail-like protein
MAGVTYDPLRSFKFHVTLVGQGAFGEIGFQKVSGLKESSGVVDYREGNMMVHKRKLPGLTNYEPITLTRGAAPGNTARQLFDWRALVARYNDGEGSVGNLSPYGDGVIAIENPEGSIGFRRIIQIDVFDKGEPNSAPRRSWRVQKSWPSQLSVSDLNAEASEVLIDTLVLEHEGLKIMTPEYGNSME